MAMEAPSHGPRGQSYTAMEVDLHVAQLTASMEDLHEVGPPPPWRLTFMLPCPWPPCYPAHSLHGGPPWYPTHDLHEGDMDLFFFLSFFIIIYFLIQRGIIVFLCHFYYLFYGKADRGLASKLSPNLSIEFLKLKTRV
jgi:hypothetical protein